MKHQELLQARHWTSRWCELAQHALQAKESGQRGAEEPGHGNAADGWRAPPGCTAEKNESELLTAHTLGDRFLSETRKVKQHSAVMKRSKRAALNYHSSQCCRDWLRAQGKITSKLSHAAEREMLECAGTELSSHFCLTLKAAADSNLRIQPQRYKCVFFAAGRVRCRRVLQECPCRRIKPVSAGKLQLPETAPRAALSHLGSTGAQGTSASPDAFPRKAAGLCSSPLDVPPWVEADLDLNGATGDGGVRKCR